MTPIKKLIFSRVRMILADCHAADKEVIRCVIYARYSVLGFGFQLCEDSRGYLEFELLHLALNVARRSLYFEEVLFEDILLKDIVESFLCSHLELIALLRETTLEEVNMGVEIGFHCIWCPFRPLNPWKTCIRYEPRSVKPLAQSDISSRTNRSNGAEKYPSPDEGVPGLRGGDGGRELDSSPMVNGAG